MAVFAAAFAGSGVGKSGSPAPKSTTSMPWRFSFSASPATFMVGEVEIRPIRSASMCPLFFSQPGFHNLGNEPADPPAERKDFLDEPRADVGVLLGRHHEHSLHMRAQPAVHQRHLELDFEIRECAQ